MIPIPDIVSIKEKFMVYGRDTVKVPPLLSLQLAGDPQTHVRPSHALWVPVRGELAFGVGRPWSWSLEDVVVTLCRVRPFGSAVSWQLRAQVWGPQAVSRVWSRTLA